jgi:hypothetical protein
VTLVIVSTFSFWLAFFFCFRPREFFRSRFGKLFSKIAQLVCIFEKKEHLSQIRSAQPKAHAM